MNSSRLALTASVVFLSLALYPAFIACSALDQPNWRTPRSRSPDGNSGQRRPPRWARAAHQLLGGQPKQTS